MNVLIIHAHNEPQSFNAALKDLAVDELQKQGHAVQVSDLYAMNWNPVASAADFGQRANPEYLTYALEQRKGVENQTIAADIRGELDKVQWADLLIFNFPIYWFSTPAILKGWFDRILMPGVAFDISDPANVKPMLTNIRHISAVVTYGRPRWMAWYMGDPPRKIITRYMKRLTAAQAGVSYHAQYHMNVATREQLGRFKARVGQAMARLA